MLLFINLKIQWTKPSKVEHREPLDKKTSGKPEKTKGSDLFKKDKPKSEPKEDGKLRKVFQEE